MTKDQVKTVVVLGMHRSGSSMVAGVLNRLGVDMGRNFVRQSWSNPVGHFEDKDFVQLNKSILKEAGGSWHKPPTNEEIKVQKDNFKIPIKELIEKKTSLLWGWKDPRNSLTIGLYLPYLNNPYFIVCHRGFQDIAKSLKRRNRIEFEKGIRLAEIYEERIEDFFITNLNLRRLDIVYEEMLTDRERILRNIVDFLGIQVSQKIYKNAQDMVLPREKIRKLSATLRIERRNRRIKKVINFTLNLPYIFIRQLLNKVKSE